MPALQFEALIETLRDRHRSMLEGGGAALVERHRARGKIPSSRPHRPAARCGKPFLELSPLAAYGLYGGELPSAGIVTGIGLVHGTPCMVIANDATVKGGSFFAETVRKHLRAQEIAEQHRLPCVYLVDCGGAFLPEQNRVFPDRDHFGGTFYNQCRMSAAGIPQISAVFGGCTAGGAYIPALSDQVVMVRGTGRIHLGGPPIVKAAINEIVDGETLGGADMHATVSGVSDHVAGTETEALGRVREIILGLGALRQVRRGRRSSESPGGQSGSAHIAGAGRPQEALTTCTPSSAGSWTAAASRNSSRPTDRRLSRCSRGSMAFPSASSPTTACCFPTRSERRAFHRAGRPAPYPTAVPAEHHRLHGGHGRGARGDRQALGQTRLRGLQRARAEIHGADRWLLRRRQLRHVRTRLQAAFPVLMAERAHRHHEPGGGGHRGPELRRQSLKGAAGEAALADLDQRTRAQFEQQSDPYYATARLWDDGIIEPAQTRDVLGLCLALSADEPRDTSPRPVYRM